MTGERGGRSPRFFTPQGRLLDLPPPWHPARREVLGEVASRFPVGVDLGWREVDAVLRAAFDDHASLRRALVDDGLLTRSGDVYRRPAEPDTDPGPASSGA